MHMLPTESDIQVIKVERIQGPFRNLIISCKHDAFALLKAFLAIHFHLFQPQLTYDGVLEPNG